MASPACGRIISSNVFVRKKADTAPSRQSSSHVAPPLKHYQFNDFAGCEAIVGEGLRLHPLHLAGCIRNLDVVCVRVIGWHLRCESRTIYAPAIRS
jgi:hypothetical protein